MRTYRYLERRFEKLSMYANALLSNSVTFIIAVGAVLFWLTDKSFATADLHAEIRDVILGVTFLSMSVIQKSFNHFSASLHLKVNELVASHEPANNAVLNAEDKTGSELTELAKEYAGFGRDSAAQQRGENEL